MEEKMKKNKVYFAVGDPDYGGIYIAAPNGKFAKNLALCTWVAETVDNPFINVRVTRCWSVRETDYDGELDIFKINELGLAWWSCESNSCLKEDFEICDDGRKYKCKECGIIGDIPYIG